MQCDRFCSRNWPWVKDVNGGKLSTGTTLTAIPDENPIYLSVCLREKPTLVMIPKLLLAK